MVHKRGNDIFIHTNFRRILPNFKQTFEEQLSVFQLLYSHFSRNSGDVIPGRGTKQLKNKEYLMARAIVSLCSL